MHSLKSVIQATILSGLALGSVAQAADDGTIHFSGTISAAACSVHAVAGTSGHYGTVDFGVVSSKTLETVGTSTTTVPFSIDLVDCAVSSAPSITMNGESITATDGDIFATPVSGVGIRIEDAGAAATVYRPGISANNSGLDVLNVGEGDDAVSSASANFRASLVRVSGEDEVTGLVDTDVTFTVNYIDS